MGTALLLGYIKRSTRVRSASCHREQDPGGVPKRAPGAAPPREALTCRPAPPGRPRWLGVGRSHAPPRAVPVNASPGRVPRAQAGSRARRRESAGRDRVGEPGELCGAAACARGCRAGAGRGERLRRALRYSRRDPSRDSPSRREAQVPTAGRAGPSWEGLPGTLRLEATAEAGERPHGQVRASFRPSLCGASSR